MLSWRFSLQYPTADENPLPMTQADRELFKYRLLAGYIFVHREPSVIATVVGSGVAVSLWDKEIQYGGMVNYLYPSPENPGEATSRFGNVALRHLFRLMVEEGSKNTNLKAQIFGGAANADLNCLKVAEENIRIAEETLKKLRVEVVSRDVGGQVGRKIVFHTLNNEVMVYKVARIRASDWYPYINRDEDR